MGDKPPIYFDLLFDARAHMEIGDIQRAVIDAAVSSEALLRLKVDQVFPNGFPEPIRREVNRLGIKRIFPAFCAAIFGDKRWSSFKSKEQITNLLDDRNTILHSGKKEGLTVEICRNYLGAVSELIELSEKGIN